MNKIQRFIFLCLLSAIVVISAKSQDCKIALTPHIEISPEMANNPYAYEFLNNQIRGSLGNLVHGGLSSDQFVLYVSCTPITKNIVPGVTTKITYSLDLGCNIVDVKSNRQFNSSHIELKGIGDSETKALINAFNGLAANEKLRSFLKDGHESIVTYYNDDYTNIINKAKILASTRNFDEAIYILMCIPECCVGYNEVSLTAAQIYKQFIDQHSNENLALARSAWMASPNEEGAAVASIYLSEIYPDASCYAAANELYEEIKKQLRNNWNFQMKRWQDEIDLEKYRIDAMTQIAMAYALNQNKSNQHNK